jgi:hypothetical protein
VQHAVPPPAAAHAPVELVVQVEQEQPAAEAAEPHDRTVLNDVGHASHHIADKGADAGKKLGRGFKKLGLGIGHKLGAAGHQLKDGWKDGNRNQPQPPPDEN